MQKNEPIPEQEQGGYSDTFYTEQCDSSEEAQKLYSLAKDRLLHINEWKDLAGIASASFRLTDYKGQPVHRSVEEGDHFQISIPGPGNQTGEGYDWVCVEEIVEQNESTQQAVFIKVRPASSPLNSDEAVAHFFDEDATSTFSVKRFENKVTASVHGRNEKPNTDTNNLIDKVRNAAVSVSAISGFSKLQWSQLVKGIIKGID